MANRRLRGAIRVGIAHWAFGNLYEEVVRMPERVAERQGPGSPLGRGEPARYYLPAAPLTVVAAVVDAARSRELASAVTAGSLVVAAGIGGYLVRTVNVPLVSGAAPQGDRAAMVRSWHRWNRVRLVLLGVAAAAAGGPSSAPGPDRPRRP